jgi:hypothetical protein
MRSYLLAAAALAATAGLASAQNQDVTIHGCVVPAQNGTYVMTKVAEVPGPTGAVMPAMAHGRRVAFWLKNDDDVKKNPNRMVEVTGSIAKLSESEAEIKGGLHKDGGVVIEFEGPGRDVRASNDTVGNTVGTAGRTGAESNDVKMLLAEVNVKTVKAIEGACN